MVRVPVKYTSGNNFPNQPRLTEVPATSWRLIAGPRGKVGRASCAFGPSLSALWSVL